jgi:hypothetical protein
MDGMINPSEILVEDLLIRWWGQPKRLPPLLPVETEWLPDQLKDHHRMLARWSAVPLDETLLVRPERIRTQSGKAVFMKDHTGDWMWAFDVDDQDRVFECELGESWEVVPESLSETLLHQFLFDIVMLAPAQLKYDSIEDSAVVEITSRMQEVCFGGWRWPLPGGRIFVGDGIVVTTGPAVSHQYPWGPRSGFSTMRCGASTTFDFEGFPKSDS